MLRGGEEQERIPVTLPKLTILETPPDDIEREVREAAAYVVTQRTIRAGLDAWQAINKAESFEGWKAIGRKTGGKVKGSKNKRTLAREEQIRVACGTARAVGVDDRSKATRFARRAHITGQVFVNPHSVNPHKKASGDVATQ